MGEQNMTAELSRAVRDALEVGGTYLLHDPLALYSALTDLMPRTSPEMKALRGVLADSKDDVVVEWLARLDATSSSNDASYVASRIERHLMDERQLSESVAHSCAKGLTDGVAAHMGIRYMPTPTPAPAPVQAVTPTKSSKPQQRPVAKAVDNQAVALPPRYWNAAVSSEMFRDGGSTQVVIRPQLWDASRKWVEFIQGRDPEYITVRIPPQTKEGEGIVVYGQGYYSSDGRRGDLVVRPWIREPQQATATEPKITTPPRQAPTSAPAPTPTSTPTQSTTPATVKDVDTHAEATPSNNETKGEAQTDKYSIVIWVMAFAAGIALVINFDASWSIIAAIGILSFILDMITKIEFFEAVCIAMILSFPSAIVVGILSQAFTTITEALSK